MSFHRINYKLLNELLCTNSNLTTLSNYCFLCFSQDCCFKITDEKTGRQLEWIRDFCQLFNIPEFHEIRITIQNSLYCLDCLVTLRLICNLSKDEFYENNNDIDKTQTQLKNIKSKCFSKLNKCVNLLLKSVPKTDDENYTQIVIRRQQLLQCLQEHGNITLPSSSTSSFTDNDSSSASNSDHSVNYLSEDEIHNNTNLPSSSPTTTPTYPLSPEAMCKTEIDDDDEDNDADNDADFTIDDDSEDDNNPTDDFSNYCQVLIDDSSQSVSQASDSKFSLESQNVGEIDYTDLKLRYNLKESSIKLGRLSSSSSSSPFQTRKNSVVENLEIETDDSSTTSSVRNQNRKRSHIRRLKTVKSDDVITRYREKSKKSQIASEDFEFSCTYDDCSERFISEAKREEHVKRFHEGLKYPFACDICKKLCYSYNKLQQHQNIHKGLTPYKCPDPDCQREYATKFQLSCHFRDKRVKQERQENSSKIKRSSITKSKQSPLPFKFSCTFPNCTKQFRLEIQKDSHILRVHEKTIKYPFPCNICQQKCYTYKKLIQHGNIHTGLKPFKCPDEGCDKSYHTEQQLYAHRRHKKLSLNFEPETLDILEEVSKCPESNCGRRFRNLYKMWAHRIKEHGYNNSERIQCEFCDRVFKQDSIYKRHLEIKHSQQKHDNDNGEDSITKNTASLKKDSITKNTASLKKGSITKNTASLKKDDSAKISKEKQAFQCQYCPKLLSSRGNLNIHEQRHTKEFKHRCQLCDFGATDKYTIESHVNRDHPSLGSNDRPFLCHICANTFRHSRELNRHQKLVHPVSKDFMCTVCAKCFSNKRYLREHEETHKEIKSYQCEECAKYFTQKGALSRHIKSMHSGIKTGKNTSSVVSNNNFNLNDFF